MPSWLEKFIVGWLLKQLTPEVLVAAEEAVKKFVVCEIAALAAKTPTDVDDKVVARVAELLGVECPPKPAAA